MNPYITRHWGAIAAGAACAAVTAYVLFEDAIHGAPVGTSHILSAATLAATILAGHWALPAWRRRRRLVAAGLALVFAAGTAYLVLAAGARNAETAAAKAAPIAATNEARARETAARARSQAMLDKAQADLAAECRTGDGRACRGVRATIEVYQAALDGHDARLMKLGPPRTENAGWAHMARVIGALPGIAESPAQIEQRLVLVMPVLIVVICELATIAFVSLGVGGSGPAPMPDRPALPAPADRPLPLIVRPEPDRPADRPEARKQAILAALRAGQSAGSSAELCTRHGVPRSTMSDWLREWEASGAIAPRRIVGRTKAIGR